jgi:hypothetical protein
MTLTPIQHFFESSPQSKPLFDDLVIALLSAFEESSFKVQKSQIALVSKKPYAAVWLPIREIKDRPKVYLILSFGLDIEISHERIVEVNEPYPNRYMHHVLISSKDDIDETLLNWLRFAIDFSNRKRVNTHE